MSGRIFHLAVSPGGVPKHAIREGEVTELGIVGDTQKHTKIHGGPSRALCVFSLEVIKKLQAEGHPIFPGSVGENVIVSGIPWASLGHGTRLALGDDVIVELTKEATACKQIADSFVDRKFRRLDVPGDMRWYCKVLQTGTVRIGQRARLVTRPDIVRRARWPRPGA